MAERISQKTPERLLRLYRNLNVIGAVALAGAGVYLPQYQTLLFAGAAIDAAQAVGTELVLRRRRRTAKPA